MALASYASAGIRCVGSALPTTLSFSGLYNFGTRFASTRVTEGFPSAFQAKTGTSDTGTRIMARYSNFPPGARLFVPGARSGTMAIVRVGEDGSLNPEARVPTAQGAHCVAVDGRGGAYVCDPRGGRILHIPKEARVGVSGK